MITQKESNTLKTNEGGKNENQRKEEKQRKKFSVIS
jgi:hypothetical protein